MTFHSHARVRFAIATGLLACALACALAANGGSRAMGENPMTRSSSASSQTYAGSARDYVHAVATRSRLEASNRFLEEIGACVRTTGSDRSARINSPILSRPLPLNRAMPHWDCSQLIFSSLSRAFGSRT